MREQLVQIIVRYCGEGVGWLPIIQASGDGEELYRGSHFRFPADAFEKALDIWENRGTGNIQDFRRKHGL